MAVEYKDAYRARIGAMIDAVGADYEELSHFLGKNPAYMQQFLKTKGSPRVLDLPTREQLAPRLNCTPDDLLPKEGELKPLPKTRRVTTSTLRPPSEIGRNRTPLGEGKRDLPVLGGADEGATGILRLYETVRQFVERPRRLDGVDEAYSVFHVGEEMEDRYFSGEILHINPNKPVSSNCFVLVGLDDNTGLVRQYVRRTATDLVLRQLNPKHEMTVPLGRVVSLHRIVGAAED